MQKNVTVRAICINVALTRWKSEVTCCPVHVDLAILGSQAVQNCDAPLSQISNCHILGAATRFSVNIFTPPQHQNLAAL